MALQFIRRGRRTRTRVVHCRRDAYDVLIDRTTQWGNPFRIGVDGSRVEVVSKFRAWLLKHPELIAAARIELKGKRLGCWCHPLLCHGDVWAEVLDGKA